LDGTAVAAKTHGRQGAKPWWDGGAKGHHGGSSGGGGSKKTAEKLTAKQRYERSAPDVIKHPRGGGVEYRKRDDGRYVEYRNGKKAKHAGEDVTHSRQDLARTFRSGGHRGAPSVEARAVEARNQRQLKIERGPSKGSGQNVRATKAAQRLREGQTALPAQRFKPKPGSSGPTKTAPSGPDRVPSGSTGIEWRREPDGTYTRYKNGKKSKALIDQGYSLERVRQLEAARRK
jgi:hypothetical protein